MYTLYENKPCITGRQFIELFSKPMYDTGVQRKYFIKHGRGGNGREVVIEVETIKRTDIKAKILETFGTVEQAKCNTFIDSIVIDDETRAFFKSYRYMLGDNETSLPDNVQQQYCNEAAIFQAIDREIKMITKARQSKGKKLKLNEYWNERFPSLHTEALKKAFPHGIKENQRYCENKFKEFLHEGCISLVSGKYGNRNTEKLNDGAKMWLLATWANQVERCTGEEHLLSLYNERAKTEGWKKLKSSQTLHNFLFEPEVEKLWHGHRYGELKFKEKYGLQNSTKMPRMRDSLWYSDGTKLNYFYLNEDGEIKTTSVYEVIDVNSEFMLGYHIADSENFETQYKAYRMALQTAGHKPYEIAYDNQGGHKKLENGNFLTKIARLSIRVKPYNGKSKTIESVFGRFQQQFLKRDFYFSGQNITTKKQESKANMEFILANKANLPTLDEIKKTYEKRRNEWNNAQHPTSGKSRKETYFSTTNPQSPALQIYDMVDMFWITRPKAITYTAQGLCFTEAKTEYKYLKYGEPLQPDFDFHFNNIGREFIVKFDPEDMTMIFIYEKDSQGQLRFVTEMNTKIETFRNKQEQEEWEAAYLQQMNKRNDEKRVEVWQEMEAILRQEGKHAENYGLVSPHIKGVDTPAKHGERQEKARKVKQTHDWEKAISNAVATGDNELIDEVLDIYKSM